MLFSASVKKESIDGGIRVIEEISKEWIWTAKRRFEREEEKKQNATRAADPFLNQPTVVP